MEPRHQNDLENAGATVLERRGDDRVGEYTVEFDGSFDELESRTEHRYKCGGHTYEDENGRRYIVTALE
ncbi:hypothetical protein [Halobacterium zhouii]|uniref:hypothetical protein n=1 Tax=Halobacterium zhouii TaxID=2902624 RepID=UPI001E4D2BE7|nr:hypothetical protein [Halobacterium zhouii]